MPDNEDLLSVYKAALPSRAVLANLSLFGEDEQTRNSANALLKLLPPMTEAERRQYYSDLWKMPGLSEEELAKSPVGAATLEMLNNSKPMSGEIPAEALEMLETLRNSEPEPAAPNPPAPGEPAETPNEFAEQLANWPPRSTPPPKAEPDEQPHKWQAARPSEPSRDRQPISDSDFSNNQPLY